MCICKRKHCLQLLILETSLANDQGLEMQTYVFEVQIIWSAREELPYDVISSREYPLGAGTTYPLANIRPQQIISLKSLSTLLQKRNNNAEEAPYQW